MSCPDEQTWIPYCDGELETAGVRAAEAHLVGCERCRAFVLALRAETKLLGDALRERPLPPSMVPSEAPAGGLALGMPMMLGAITAALAGLGLLVETTVPVGAAWLSPSRLIGVNEMFFDVLFAARDRAPAAVEFAVAVAVTASLAAGITFVAGVLLRRVSGSGMLAGIVLALLLAPPPARAVIDVRDDERITVPAGEIVEATLIASGKIVRIEGEVDGSLLVLAEELDLSGTVRGNVVALVREVRVSGEIEGSLFGAAEDFELAGSVVGDVVMAGDRVGVTERGSVGRDLATFSGGVEVGGRVGRDWLGAMERALLTGSVGRGAEIYAERLDVTATAVVGRDLRVHTRDEDNVTVAQGARLGGSLETLPPEHFQHDWRSRYAEPHFYAWLVLRLVAALGVGLLLHALLPGLFAGAIPTTRDFFLTTAKGFAAAVLTPLALVLVALTLVGVPLALLGAGLFVGAIYLAGILVATLIGRTLVPARGDSLRDFALVLLVGLGVLAVGEVLPGVSGVIHVLVVLTGLGLLIDRAMAHWRQRHA